MSASTVTIRTAGEVGRTDIFWELARPRTPADRRRARLVTTGVAGTGMFLLAALALTLLRGETDFTVVSTVDVFGNITYIGRRPLFLSLAPFLRETGTRHGFAFGAVILAVPCILFGLQALRTGTAARERRLAALSLAGATRPQLRRLAFLEGTRAALLGSLLAGPAYLLLWLAVGKGFPVGTKMLPTPTWGVGLGWVALVAVLTLAGGLTARAAARTAAVSPLGLTRRRPRPLRSVDAAAPAIGLIIVAVSLSAGLGWVPIGTVWESLSLVGLLILALAGGPWFIQLIGQLTAGRGGLVTGMASRRLLADVRSPGRVVGVLFAVGVSFGAIATQVGSLFTPGASYDLPYLLGGYSAATAGAVFACVVATSSMVVGATEQVLDGRRSIAVLVALAASPRFVVRVVRRQLLLAAVPATVLGALVGAVVTIALLDSEGVANDLLAVPIAIVAAGLAATAGGLFTARAVRPAILESAGPENLRAP